MMTTLALIPKNVMAIIQKINTDYVTKERLESLEYTSA